MFLTCIIAEFTLSPVWILWIAFRHFGDLAHFRNALRYRFALMFYRLSCLFDLPLWVTPIFKASSPIYRTTAKKRSSYKQVYHSFFNKAFNVHLGRFLHFSDMTLEDLRLYLNYHSATLTSYTQKCLGAYSMAPARS